MKKTNHASVTTQSRVRLAAMKGGVRGKYGHYCPRGTNVVLLEADVAEAFSTEAAVNEALRASSTHESRAEHGRAA